MREPAAIVQDLERHSDLPPGSEERFFGYGVMGLPFRSGHVLGLRRFPASSIGPGYRSVWHRDPNGGWTFCGGRAVGERAGGFPITAQKTVGVPAERLFDAFVDEATRLAGSPTESFATKPRYARFDWGAGETRVNVTFFSVKGEAKSTVALEHEPLGDGEQAAEMKARWRERLSASSRSSRKETSMSDVAFLPVLVAAIAAFALGGDVLRRSRRAAGRGQPRRRREGGAADLESGGRAAALPDRGRRRRGPRRSRRDRRVGGRPAARSSALDRVPTRALDWRRDPREHFLEARP
jgi:hypothetical protein